jgi:raffinose/stachyose/melibiose transport system substrate-binding protein
MKSKNRILVIFMSILLIFTLAACNSTNTTSDNADSGKSNDGEKQITLKFFSANPDRTTGVGKIEQDIIDSYMKENPNVKIEVEALQDEPYKNKIKIYSSTNKLPDIMHTWGQESFIAPLIANGLLLELNQDDFNDYGFVPGSLDGFSKDGKLYGLPKNTDLLPIFYNKKIFKDNGIEVPKTQDELLAAVKTLRKADINPISINGMDGWTFPIWFEYVLQRETGDFSVMDKALTGKESFDSLEVVNAAKFMSELAEAGGFQDGFLTADYGTSRNLFGQEQAAMYIMGSWEMGLASDQNFPESFRNNLGVFAYPASEKGNVEDVAVWHGGGYSISKNTANKEEAVKFLTYFYEQENWVKGAWQSGAAIPAQKFDNYLTGKETDVQKDLISIFNSIKTASGTPVLDQGKPEFKETIMKLQQELLSKSISPEEFAKKLEEAGKKNREN